MTERLKVHAWKACVSKKGHRGFESLSLRHFIPFKENDLQGGVTCLMFPAAGISF